MSQESRSQFNDRSIFNLPSFRLSKRRFGLDVFQPRRRPCRGSWPRDVDPLRNWFRFPSKRSPQTETRSPASEEREKDGRQRPPLEISSREIFDILSSVHGVRRLDLRLFHLNGSLRAYHSEKGRPPPSLCYYPVGSSVHEKQISRVRLYRNHPEERNRSRSTADRKTETIFLSFFLFDGYRNKLFALSLRAN